MSDFMIRETAPDDLRTAAGVLRTALLEPPPSDDEWQRVETSWIDQRSLSAWVDDECIGHTSAFEFLTTVPGGRQVRTAGVTRVGVLPTHTRRGVLSGLMGSLLTAARADGQALASLRASEATIYGRFGFGVAGHVLASVVDTVRARPVTQPATGAVRLIPSDQILSVLPEIYDRSPGRPGAITRPGWMWRRYYEDALSGTKPSFVAVHTSVDGVDDGFAHYSLSWDESIPGHDHGTGSVLEVFGVSADVERALWAHLLNIDLVRRFVVDCGPVDDVVRSCVRDKRAVLVTGLYDEQWLRILDVGAALSARAWPPGRALVVEVTDDRFAENCGRWRISDDGVSSTGEPADLATDIASLSAAYLGATSWWELAAAGAVRALHDRALAQADELFAVRPLAFCGSEF